MKIELNIKESEPLKGKRPALMSMLSIDIKTNYKPRIQRKQGNSREEKNPVRLIPKKVSSLSGSILNWLLFVK